jgi:hypothetical protein
MSHPFIKIMLSVFCFVLFTAPLSASNRLPKTVDGLELQSGTKLAVVYLQPGETLQDYSKVMLDKPEVAFRKNWQRDFNRDAVSLTMQIKDSDVKKIKEELAREFMSIFTAELEAAGHEVVTESAKDVLLIRPAIVDLAITAPDTGQRGGMTRVATSGEMTLYMELHDSFSGDKLALVADTQTVGEHGITYGGSAANNRPEFQKTLKAWAQTLTNGMAELKQSAAK